MSSIYNLGPRQI